MGSVRMCACSGRFFIWAGGGAGGGGDRRVAWPAEADVIIIGAGVAGLAAADVLAAEGKQVLILEGRGRIGGRIETMHDPAWNVPIERGAEFIHGKPRETLEIVRAGACSLYDLRDEHWIFEKGRLTKRDDFFGEIEKVLGVVAKVRDGSDICHEAVARIWRAVHPGKRSGWRKCSWRDLMQRIQVSCRRSG